MGAVLELSAKQHSQSSPIWVEMGWIGFDIQQVHTVSTTHSRYVSNGSHDLFLYFQHFFFHKTLLPSHFLHMLFYLQLVSITLMEYFLSFLIPHCKYIDCQKYNKSSHVLPLPFWHLITVDKWYCTFQKYFLHHTDCSQPVYKYFQKYNFSWCTYLQCISNEMSQPQVIYNPISAMGFLAMFNFQLQIILRGKHCRRPIASIYFFRLLCDS